MDYLDIMQGRYFSTLTGKYYEELPVGGLVEKGKNPNTRAVGVPMDYETVDPTEWRYRNLITNLVEKEAATLTIKTREALGYKVGSFIITMDGRLCEITSVIQDVRSAQKEALRIFPAPFGTEYIIRLTERDNPWGIT